MKWKNKWIIILKIEDGLNIQHSTPDSIHCFNNQQRMIRMSIQFIIIIIKNWKCNDYNLI